MSLNEAIHAAIDARLESMDTLLPAVVERYDFTKRKADVKPEIKRPNTSGILVSLPVVVACPVWFPWGGQGSASSLTFPISKGNTGILFCAGRSIENWLAKGGDSDPGDPRKFDLSDGIFVPGIAPFSTSGPAEDNSSLVLRHGDVSLRFNGGRLTLGNSQAELLDIVERILLRLQTTVVPTAVGTYPLVYSGSPLGLEIANILLLLGFIKGDS